jgi:hypothetical protein
MPNPTCKKCGHELDDEYDVVIEDAVTAYHKECAPKKVEDTTPLAGENG